MVSHSESIPDDGSQWVAQAVRYYIELEVNISEDSLGCERNLPNLVNK